ncbi:MAG: phospho-N-acetylmuramoyl-pentapeptide-transferase [Acidobacteria bacterium]|nr:MAG: phospho-N-acetylmuramoyl-pentapeptide-transferase [Acidobacteriota bacterium]PYS09987.1 MAG: phospho-N-acetylmuramoyl-pentapeptide-transferase [Acidobacteriota bacterium]
MLYHILYEFLYPLNHLWAPLRVLNVFQYITFRTAYASLTALLISLLLGPWLITRLREFQIGQHIREEGPQSHQKKAGTPTMGGVLIVVSIIVPTLLWANLRTRYLWLAVLATLAFGAVGFADDYIKIVRRRSLGLTAREKIGLQTLFSICIGIYLLYLTNTHQYETKLTVPFFKTFAPDLLIDQLFTTPFWFFGYLPFLFVIWIVIVGSSNTVNLTDGLDGLAIGCTLIASAALTALTYVTSNSVLSDYLDLQYIRQAGELTIFCGSMVGASLGFLWYNAHPAEVFMGDVGSLALGGAIGTVAVIIKQELLLIFIGGVFVAEGLSVIIQVASFKLRGKRVFRMAPLHHHFELAGWSESKVIIRFWIASLILSLFSLSTLKLR